MAGFAFRAAIFALLSCLVVATSAKVAVTCSVAFDEAPSAAFGNLVLQVYKLGLDQNNHPIPVSSDTIYNNFAGPYTTVSNLQYNAQTFSVALDPGAYSLFVFVGFGSASLDLSRAPPLGWYATEPSGWFAAMDLRNVSSFDNCHIQLKASHLFSAQQFAPPPPQVTGKLEQVKGYTVMKLWGNATSRAFAHGYLSGPQIIDWFRFYVLERVVFSASKYLKTSVPFLLKSFAKHPDFIAEQQSMLAGMRAAGTKMFVPELNRDFEAVDILAISAYIELGDCSQLAVWGNQTVDGHTISARNMDGELDIRKVTVSHLVIFAITPAPEENSKRFISVMWPGFLGTLSSVNEDGVHAMMNTGMTSLNQTTGFSPVSWILRKVISQVDANTATPGNILSIINQYKSLGGGPSWTGTVFFFAKPYQPGYTSANPPAFVFEGDRFGGVMRLPGQFAPAQPNCVMATNHFLAYGANPYNPDLVFGQTISFSSKARYWTGSGYLQSMYRTNQRFTTANAEIWLERAAVGYTEHSIYFTPHNRLLRIAVAQFTPTMWDAPFTTFTEFPFESLF